MAVETPYGLLLTTFFSGATGMRLQSLGNQGKDALLLGAFLTANDWSNMIGLYEISLGKLARHLPVLKSRNVTRAFAALDAERFAHYDSETEFVWVREMARIRLRLERGQVIRNPKVLTGAQNCYQRLPMNPFLSPFYDRYHVELALKHRRGGPPESDRQSDRQSIGNRSSIGATPDVRTQVLQRSSDQVPVHQASVQAVRSNNDQVDQVSSISEEQPAPSHRSAPLEPASFQTLCAIATEVLEQHGDDLDNISDLTARVKELSIRRQRDYGENLDRLRGAIDGALTAYRKRTPGFSFKFDQPAQHSSPPPAERPDPTVSRTSEGMASIAEVAEAIKGGGIEQLATRLRQVSGGRR
jgi:hypothetical protein